MNPLIVCNYYPDDQQSMLRFGHLLATNMPSASVWRPPLAVGRVCTHTVHGLSKFIGYFDKFILGQMSLSYAKSKHDLVHIADHSNAGYIRILRGTPTLVTCHDLLAIRAALGEIPQNKTRATGRMLQRWILSGLQRADHIVSVSHQTDMEVGRLLNIPQGRHSVIENALNHPYSVISSEMARVRLLPFGIDGSSPFVFHIGGNQWYKNRIGVVNGFDKWIEHSGDLEMRLVLAGKEPDRQLRDSINNSPNRNRIRYIGTIDNDALEACYNAAQLLLFPSLDEGFGWPIAEAQACGCPVVTTNRPPMRDVAGNGAEFMIPEDMDSIVNAIDRALLNRESLRTAGILNSSRFNPLLMINKYLDLYRRLTTGDVIIQD